VAHTADDDKTGGVDITLVIIGILIDKPNGVSMFKM
jgi:hypothetical protein